MKTNFSLKLFFLFVLISNLITSQHHPHLHHHKGIVRCATVEYDQIRRNENAKVGSQLEFEAWLQQEIKAYKQQKSGIKLPVLTIPVVVHVIHNGDAVGSGENITDAQVLSQIQVLNEDFRKMANSRGYNTNPVGADVEIEFCLASIDPNGNTTNGIDRVNMGQTSWDRNAIESTLKPQTIWDPNNYLNMWTCRFGGSASSLLGYAQFPDNSGLSGLNPSGGSANTDGVVMNYNAFGTADLDDGSFVLNPTYNLGRTTTHEVGHWLGLRHIWGDGNCSQDDYCNDTPLAGAANYGCPTGSSSCSSVDMIENYMDYTDDACMNIFTEDQKARIRTVLSVCPRRASLTTSTVCSNASAPPTCAISASSTTIIAGGSINFTDGSTGNPTSWSWNFDNTGLGGVSPATSTSQNPTNITYNNVGTYQVQLTATNTNGSCTSTQTINVVLSSGCDTLSNFVATDSLTVYLSNQGNNPFGYIAGWNNFSDISKAEYYNNYSPYTHVTGLDIYFYGVNDGGNGATVDFNVWGDNSGAPGNILGTATATLAQLDNALASNSGLGVLHVTFPSPVNVGGNPFYCGISMNGFGNTDSLAIITSTVNTPTNTGWEQWSNNAWYPYNDQDSWDVNLTHYILPYVTDQPVSATITATPTTSCTGTPINFNATGTNANNYSWFFPGATIDTASGASSSATYSTSGSYTAYLLVDGTCRGRYLDSVQITITDGPTISSTTTTPSCSGNDGQIIINATNGTTPYQYSIDGGNTYQTSNTFTNLTGGSYTVSVMDASGCQSSESVTINNGTGTLTVTTVDTNPSCGNIDGSIAINVNGGASPYNFSIDNGQSFSSGSAPYTFSSLGVGTYNIVVQDANGCQGFSSTNLINSNAPTLTSNAVDVSCNGSSDGQLFNTATGGTYPYQYSIDGGSNFQASGTFGGLSGGNYTVIVQDANGCQATGNAVINESSPMTHTVSITHTTCGNDNGNIAIIPNGGTTPYQYSINGGATFQANGFFNTLQGGNYSVVVVDANGCSSTISSETIQGSGTFSVSATTTGETCMDANGSITVTETGGLAPYQYSINGGLNFQNTGLFTGLSANNYNIVLQDANGCTTNTSTTITNQGGFNLSVTPDQTVCLGNTATITAGGAGSGSTYSWDNGLGSGTMHIVTPSQTTTYTVIANDTQGCSRTATTTITVNTQPNVTVTPANPTICSGDSVTLIANGAQSYVWNNGTTLNTITVAPTSQTQYVVIGQNGNCNGTPVNTTINVNPSPTIVANASPLTIPVGGTVNFSNNGSVATSYNWIFGDGTNSTQGSPSHTYNTDGTYNVVLSGVLGNCEATDTITIIVGNGGPTSINNFKIEEAVQVYPNPTNGLINLSIELPYYQDIEYVLFDAIGKVIQSQQAIQVLQLNTPIDFSNNAKGVYYLRIQTELGQTTKRISLIK
ncbi:MAG: PKD domain-containing protein [Flavobacteriales bacterium]|jgi:PKD repeat protein|nr:PKD domain-containing protein [Flavobacteriales bacterium]